MALTSGNVHAMRRYLQTGPTSAKHTWRTPERTAFEPLPQPQRQVR